MTAKFGCYGYLLLICSFLNEKINGPFAIPKILFSVRMPSEMTDLTLKIPGEGLSPKVLT